MHDPSSVLFEIGRFATVWHEDPCKDGSDDSCGRFMRARHGDPAVLKRIISHLEYAWTSNQEPYGALFYKDTGKCVRSFPSTVLWIFHGCLWIHYNHDRRKMKKFLKRNLLDILLFAENPVDGLFDNLNQTYGVESQKDRIESMASCIYGWILRAERPWYKNPLFHVHHWSIQFHPWQRLRRRLFDRCCVCGKPFIGEAPCTDNWYTPKVGWFRSVSGLYHHSCSPRKEAEIDRGQS